MEAKLESSLGLAGDGGNKQTAKKNGGKQQNQKKSANKSHSNQNNQATKKKYNKNKVSLDKWIAEAEAANFADSL